MRPTHVDEVEEGEPHAVARENALRKAQAAAERLAADEAGCLVVGVDTVVALDGAIYGKPADADAARATLARLSGATHDVVSGLALVQDGTTEVASAVTRVTFRRLDAEAIDWYVGLGEWHGRAGGYAIQEAGGALVRSIDGDYLNVVGLPVALLLDRRPHLLSGA